MRIEIALVKSMLWTPSKRETSGALLAYCFVAGGAVRQGGTLYLHIK